MKLEASGVFLDRVWQDSFCLHSEHNAAESIWSFLKFSNISPSDSM